MSEVRSDFQANQMGEKMTGAEILKKMDEGMKTTRGGARPGAGRKPRETPREAITVRLEPQDAAKLRDLCKACNVSQADWVADKIKRARK